MKNRESLKNKLLTVTILALILALTCSCYLLISGKPLSYNAPPIEIEEPPPTETKDSKKKMCIIQTEKYSKIYYSDKDEPERLSVPDEVKNPNGQIIINYLDVGQADSTFIILPDGKSILIDCAESSNADFIINYIKSCNIDTIDYLINTHMHSDHIGGTPAIIKAFNIVNFYMPNSTHTTKNFENLLDAIANKGIKPKIAKTGVELFDFSDLKAEFIAPNKDYYDNFNNYSAVLKLTYKEKSFIFMGDAESEVENEILSGKYDIKADVLKVAHHGSSTSSLNRFIKAASPKYAVISCGRGNSYGHPTQQTLATLKNNNIEIWRTDLQSTVIAVSDGFNVTLSSNYNSVEINAPPDETVKPQENITNSEEKTYITKTGSKRHRDGCSSLSKSKILVKLSDVVNTHPPCKRCNPN